MSNQQNQQSQQNQNLNDYESSRFRTLRIVASIPEYQRFIDFVKDELAPHMQMDFVEEKFYKNIWNDMWTNQHYLLQMPRGHGKTEIFGVWATIYLAVTQPYNPITGKEIQQQMILCGDDKARRMLGNRIKHFFYENEDLRRLVPSGAKKDRKNDYWNDDVMYLKNGHIILFRSIGSRAIRGNHVDRLYADDLITEQSGITDSTCKEIWMGAVDGTTTNKQAMVQVTGTPLRMSDVLFYLAEPERGYFFKKLPAFIDEKKKIILSPKRWTYVNLIKTKQRIGSVKFQCEYMLDPIDDTMSLIKGEWLDQCKNNQIDICKIRLEDVRAIYLGVDFAFSDRKTADRSAFVIIAEIRKENKTYYRILDIITRKGMSAMEQFKFIQELHSVYKFDLIAVEENSIKAVVKEIKTLNLPIKRFWTGSHDEKEEMYKGKKRKKEFTTVSKRNLILRLGTAFEQRQIEIPTMSHEAKTKFEELRQECISFAQEEDKLIEIGVHPDIPIALAYAMEVSTRWNTGYMSFSNWD